VTAGRSGAVALLFAGVIGGGAGAFGGDDSRVAEEASGGVAVIYSGSIASWNDMNNKKEY